MVRVRLGRARLLNAFFVMEISASLNILASILASENILVNHRIVGILLASFMLAISGILFYIAEGVIDEISDITTTRAEFLERFKIREKEFAEFVLTGFAFGCLAIFILLALITIYHNGTTQ